MRHPDFDDRIVAFADMLHGRTELYDDNSHGTHVSSIIGGSGRMSGGRYEGMAPKCQLVVVKVLDEKGNGNIGNVLHGIQWVLENRARFQIRIVNISVGTLPSVNEEGAEKLVQAVEALWDVGIVVKPDLLAPGSYITSCNARYREKGQKPYTMKSGTSMSTPVVSGAIALLLSKYPDMSNVEVKLRLRESSIDIGRPQNEQGWGLLNVEKLLNE